MVFFSEEDNAVDQPLLDNQEHQKTWDTLGTSSDPWEQLKLGVVPPDLEECVFNEFRDLKAAYDEVTHVLRQEWNKCDKHAYNKKYEAMQNLMSVWTNITPQKFVVTVEILGKDCKDYLKLLSYPLLHDDWLVIDPPTESEIEEEPGPRPQEWQWLKGKLLQRAKKVFEYFPNKLEHYPAKAADGVHVHAFPDYEMLQKWNASVQNNSFQQEQEQVRTASCLCNFLSYLNKPPKVLHAVHWTAATRLLYNISTDTQVRMLNALRECGDDSEAFNTLISRMIAQKAADAVHNQYIFRLVQDVFYIVLLGGLTFYIIVFRADPPWQLRWPIICFAGRALLIPIVDLLLSCCRYGKQGFIISFTFWNFFIVGSEMASAIAMFSLMFNPMGKTCDYHLPSADEMDQECQVVRHPVKFSIAVLMKWIHLLFEMMCLPGFGQTVLPAFYAVLSKDTLWFSLLLMLVLLGSFQSYWSLPIPANMPHNGVSHRLNTILKIFNLDILGIADMPALEGVNERLVIHMGGNGTTFKGHLQSPRESLLYHDAIGILTVFLVTVVSILTMNVTIGVVGEAYTYNKSNANQIWCHYCASYNIKLLLTRCLFPCSPGFRAKDNHPEVSDGRGIFIGCHETHFLDVSDTQETLQEMIDQEKDVTEKLVNFSKERERSELLEKELTALKSEKSEKQAFDQQQQQEASDIPRSNDQDDQDDHATVGCSKFLSSR